MLRTMSTRILLLHDHPIVLASAWRICDRHQVSLQLIPSQSALINLLSEHASPSDLVIAKDIKEDYLTVAATLLACRAFGVRTPFLVVAEPSDRWTKNAVASVDSAVLIDDRSSRWLIPLLLEDWLDRVCKLAPYAIPPVQSGSGVRLAST